MHQPIELESEARIRSALVCTWHSFFAHFPHLRDVQRASIIPILKGESVIVNAPTASGKTEAIMAPVIERYLKHRNQLRMQSSGTIENSLKSTAGRSQTKGHVDTGTGPAILLIAPTKALCNDLCRRLSKPVQDVGLNVSIRTGDNPNFNPEKPPHIVITTPESLDSLLARKPASFLYLETIIMDEIHLIHANGRGDQMQCLLQRLKKLNSHPLQICASSATVPEIERIREDFLGNDGRMISCPCDNRDIRSAIEYIPNEPKTAIQTTVEIVTNMLTETPTRKLIVFCNARANVENIVHALRENPRIAPNVFAHHGSLSRDERLRTEQMFLRARNAVCVATSTLELGIDIGDVDRIVLLGPPPDVSSLIQRIGRGSRTQKFSHVCCLANCEFNARRFEHLVECARKDMLFPDPVAFRPTTIVQQALSICLQNPQCWVGKKALFERLPETTHSMYSLNDCGVILDEMQENGLFRKVEHGRYVPEAKTQFLFSRGYMHSMIADRPETDVVDSTTGRTIGSVYLKQSRKNDIAEGRMASLKLAGNQFTATSVKDGKLFVKRGSESTELGFLALEPPRYSLALARDFARFMHIPSDAFYFRCLPPTVDITQDFTPEMGDMLRKDLGKKAEDVTPGCEFLAHHFMGTIGSLLLQYFFETFGNTVKKGGRTPFFLRLVLRPTITSFPSEEQLILQFEMYIRANVSSFSRLLQPGPWFNVIPEDIALKWLLQSIDVKSYAKALANLPIILI